MEAEEKEQRDRDHEQRDRRPQSLGEHAPVLVRVRVLFGIVPVDHQRSRFTGLRRFGVRVQHLVRNGVFRVVQCKPVDGDRTPVDPSVFSDERDLPEPDADALDRLDVVVFDPFPFDPRADDLIQRDRRRERADVRGKNDVDLFSSGSATTTKDAATNSQPNSLRSVVLIALR